MPLWVPSSLSAFWVGLLPREAAVAQRLWDSLTIYQRRSWSGPLHEFIPHSFTQKWSVSCLSNICFCYLDYRPGSHNSLSELASGDALSFLVFRCMTIVLTRLALRSIKRSVMSSDLGKDALLFGRAWWYRLPLLQWLNSTVAYASSWGTHSESRMTMKHLYSKLQFCPKALAWKFPLNFNASSWLRGLNVAAPLPIRHFPREDRAIQRLASMHLFECYSNSRNGKQIEQDCG